MSNFSERLEEALYLRDMTPAELSRATGIGEGAISQYRKGICKAAQRNLEKISQALSVPIPWLMGVSDERTPPIPTDLIPASFGKIPLVGQIACGTPILAQEHIEDYVDLPKHIRADFALSCKGDSMIDAGIQNGDIVYIRAQSIVENGQIAAVMVDGGEATLKRFYSDKNTVQLIAANPKYPPMIFIDEDIENRIRILGLAVAFTHPLLGE